ncbi:MAG: 1,4-alpha-glucan branching protein domain-containing protein [Phycisphaerae bacterium]
MADPLGNLCIVLHGHLPYVLHHGEYPHGEAWLYEAACETYLPLLDMIGECALMNARPALTIGLTPVLLEQLAHDRFKAGFAEYLKQRIDRAEQDQKAFDKAGDKHNVYLADWWRNWHEKQLEHFEKIDRDIPAEFAKRFREGHIQILTSNATHCYMPLVLNDEMLHAQMACGTASSKKHLGQAPTGMWLPECAYRPSWEHWMPSVLYDNPRSRPGIEKFIYEAGVTHFFVESHMVANCQPMGTREGTHFNPVQGDPSAWDYRRGWREAMEPVGVVSGPMNPGVFAFARHPRVSEQVWSADTGYPGSGQYLEFHRKHGERGLRYHKVTHRKAPLSQKDPYYPDDIPGLIHEHAAHFSNVVRETLGEYRWRTGRQGTVVASFDAELFGHWWFEGIRFLRDVTLNLANDPTVMLRTAEEALYHPPADKVVRLPEGSWGKNGNHTVWMNEQVRWIWEIEYRAEGEFLRLLHKLPWQTDPQVQGLMEKAGRQLLLLQASDWPFVIESGGATDYGHDRLSGHSTRFTRLTRIAEKVAGGHELAELDKIQVAEADAHDNIFPDIDLNWWMKS